MIYFLTGITQNYNWKPTLGELPIDVITIDSSQVSGLPETQCLQHGAFTECIRLALDDIVVFTDADMVMQRALVQREIDWLHGIGPGQVAVGYNADETETLAEEATRLRRNEFCHPERDWYEAICYNTGVVAARYDTWMRLYNDFLQIYQTYYPMFGHWARQQWVISLVIHRMFEPVVMPYTFHMHGHYPLPKGGYKVDNTAYYKDEKVLLRHKL
jgi:hypothetical protein